MFVQEYTLHDYVQIYVDVTLKAILEITSFLNGSFLMNILKSIICTETLTLNMVLSVILLYVIFLIDKWKIEKPYEY